VTIAVRETTIMRVLVTGATGQLGSYLLEALVRDGRHGVIAWSRDTTVRRHGEEVRPVALTDPRAVVLALDASSPDVIIHTAAVSKAEAVFANPAEGWAVNVHGTGTLASWCRNHGRRLLFTSTDMVFDGTRCWYREDEQVAPVVEYGRTKAAAEREVIQAPRGLVARISLLFGLSRSGRDSFFDRAVAGLRAGQPQVFFEDEFRTPLDFATAALALFRLAESEAHGIVHVGGRERVSRFELMLRAAVAMELDTGLIRANRKADLTLVEPRPTDLSLDTSRLDSLLPDLDRPSIERALRGAGESLPGLG
jgi:dTDP-4-dehydrorhamnose reductase